MNFYQARPRLAQAGAVFAAAALIAGCGNNYRPSITSISNSGPPAQPASYVAVVSAPSASAPGVATIIDYSGDSIIATATIGPGPTSFTLDATGTTAYTIQSDQTMWSFPVSTSLQEKQVSYTTLPPNAQPLNLLAPSAGLWASDLSGNLADLFQGSPETYVRSVPVAPAPVMLAGAISSPARLFALSQNIAAPTGVECNTPPFSAITSNGTATGIETSNFSVSSQLVLDPSNPTNDPHGAMNARCPVYAVVSSDGQRLFVLNRGSDTVSVINIPNDTLDNCVCPSTGCVNQDNQKYTCHPILPLSLNAVAALNTITPTPSYATPPNGTSGMTQTAGPVYAEYNGATNQLVVANYDAGTISVIDVTLDEYGNDSPTFGTTYTIPVGANPASVTVLYDGSRAYTANQTDQTVTIVYLASHTVKKTLTGITGHPRTVVSTQNSTQGKVYVASPDSEVLTIIRTDQDIVDTTLPMVGNIVDTRVSSQNAVGGNSNNVSRIPGYGQPCNLPPSLEPAPVGAQTPLQVCQQMP